MKKVRTVRIAAAEVAAEVEVAAARTNVTSQPGNLSRVRASSTV